MTANIEIKRVTVDEATIVATLVGELLAEIMRTIGEQAFNVDLNQMIARTATFIETEKYFIFVAWDNSADQAAGVIALIQSYALYAEGAFGTIPELYVRPAYRSAGVGRLLLEQAKTFGAARGWTRLEVTTPPLPEFDRTLRFYEKHGFAITGGRKLKVAL